MKQAQAILKRKYDFQLGLDNAWYVEDDKTRDEFFFVFQNENCLFWYLTALLARPVASMIFNPVL